MVWGLIVAVPTVVALLAMDEIGTRYPVRWQVIHWTTLAVAAGLVAKQDRLVHRLRLPHVLVGGVATILLLGGVVYPLVRYGF